MKLNNNIISTFLKLVLFPLKKLYYLDLSNNLISTLFPDHKVPISDLQVVSIKNNRLSTISVIFFDDLSINIIVTDNHFQNPCAHM